MRSPFIILEAWSGGSLEEPATQPKRSATRCIKRINMTMVIMWVEAKRRREMARIFPISFFYEGYEQVVYVILGLSFGHVR